MRKKETKYRIHWEWNDGTIEVSSIAYPLERAKEKAEEYKDNSVIAAGVMMEIGSGREHDLEQVVAYEIVEDEV